MELHPSAPDQGPPPAARIEARLAALDDAVLRLDDADGNRHEPLHDALAQLRTGANQFAAAVNGGPPLHAPWLDVCGMMALSAAHEQNDTAEMTAADLEIDIKQMTTALAAASEHLEANEGGFHSRHMGEILAKGARAAPLLTMGAPSSSTAAIQLILTREVRRPGHAP